MLRTVIRPFDQVMSLVSRHCRVDKMLHKSLVGLQPVAVPNGYLGSVARPLIRVWE